MAKRTKHSQQFKEDAVKYRQEHSDLPLSRAAANLGISESALKSWCRAAKDHEGEIPTRGSGNYSSDEAKEIARLQRELRDAKDALEVLKKAIGILTVLRTAVTAAAAAFTNSDETALVNLGSPLFGCSKEKGLIWAAIMDTTAAGFTLIQ